MNLIVISTLYFLSFDIYGCFNSTNLQTLHQNKLTRITKRSLKVSRNKMENIDQASSKLGLNIMHISSPAQPKGQDIRVDESKRGNQQFILSRNNEKAKDPSIHHYVKLLNPRHRFRKTIGNMMFEQITRARGNRNL